MTRRSISTTRRAKIFRDSGGLCHICGAKIDGAKERWEVEHVIPLAMGGDDDGDNLKPAHARCHASKTTNDARAIAKAKRVAAKHTGAFRSRQSMPGSRDHPLKRKVSGETVKRERNQQNERL